jgi:LytS/YehU family sensor histidine kinase
VIESDREAGRRRWVSRALLVGFSTIIGLLLFSYRYLDDLTRAQHGTLAPRLIEEMTGAYGAMILVPGVIWIARRFRPDRAHWARYLSVHLIAVITFSALHTTLNALSRNLIFPLAGLGAYDYGIMRIRYFMELPNDVLIYVLIVAFVYLFDHYRATRDHEVRAAQLESRLAQAQLQNLRLQLQPHFLFNALNTISSIMYDDPRTADVMLGKLSDLLRHTLRAVPAQETTLEEELRVLGLYVDLMRARFEERLAVRIEVESGAERALVPQLILQPLVENAIRHGFDPVTSRREIDVRCARENGSLSLEVRDHGPGLAVPAEVALRSGVGLSNTASRLAQLYGAAHRLELGNADGGGLRVSVVIPYHGAA